jgi:hypothetical protein
MTAPLPHASSMPLPLFRRGEWYESYDTIPVGDTPLRLSVAPDLVLRHDLRRAAARHRPAPLSAARRQEITRTALHLFTTAPLPLGPGPPQTPEEFATQLDRIAGLPAPLVGRWGRLLDEAVRALPAGPARPASTLVWLPGNTFTCLVAVAEAVLLGGHVVVRPSRREPVSALRLTAALLEAGWPPEQLSLYPTAPTALLTLIRATDRQIVYGSSALAGALPPQARAQLELRGPGRGCAVVGADDDPGALVPWLTGLIAADSGRFCSNVCTIACLADPEALGQQLATALDGIRLDPPDLRWPVAAAAPPLAAGFARLVKRGLQPGDRTLTRRPTVTAVRDRTYLAPTLVAVTYRPGHPLLGCELPFPFAAVVGVDPAQAAVLSSASLFRYPSGRFRDAGVAHDGGADSLSTTMETPR